MALEIFRLVGSVFVDTNEANKSLQKTDQNAQGFGKTLLEGITTAAKWAAGIATAAGAAATALSVASVKSYADYEQLVGGVETLFKDNSDTVLKYAEGAYKTAGMTANEYLETVTGFSASLLQGLNGDTAAAAKVADMAITDMSDNANKMGTSIESIRYAYQGFAKQNYTMLDNLKLGYGGTKEEMIRLLEDATKLSGVEYNLSNLNDVYEAIHVSQTEMGITGTTAAEGTSTISGGIALIKAKLEDFKTTIGSALAPVVQGFISTVIEKLPTIQGWVEQLTPLLSNMLSGILDVIPVFVQGLISIVEGFQNAVTWGKEHETVLGLIALAVGALTVAIGLYQAAEAIKNIAVTAGVAAHGSATVAMGLHTVATNIATAATTAFGSVMAFITSPITLVVAAIAALIAIIYLLVDNWDVVSAAAIKCWDWIKGTWNKVAEWFNTYVIQPIVKHFSGLWAEITGAASAAWDVIKLVWELVEPFFSSIWEAIKLAAGVLWTFISTGFKIVWEEIKLVWSVVVSFFKIIWEGIKGVFSVVKEVLLGFFKTAWEAIKAVWNMALSFFTMVWAGIKAVFAVVKGVLSGDFSSAWEAIKNLWSKATGFFSSIWTGIKNVFSSTGSWFGSTFKAAWNAIKNVFSAWGSFFGNLWNQIKNTFSNIGTNIANAISSSVKAGLNGVISSIEGIINSGVNMINGAINLINNIPGVNIGRISRLYLPRLARGGVVDEPTVAQIGEDGAEAVVPLEKNTGWIDRLSDKVAHSIVVQQGQVESERSLDKVLDKMDELLDALQANQTITLNKREFARIVKEVG